LVTKGGLRKESADSLMIVRKGKGVAPSPLRGLGRCKVEVSSLSLKFHAGQGVFPYIGASAHC